MRKETIRQPSRRYGVMNNTVPAMVDALGAIWQRVLQRPQVAAHENFFDLGGNPSSAAELFRQISALCGREIPPPFIYQAPTLAALARELEQPRQMRSLPLLLLKPGAGGAPVYLVHGLGGSVMEFFYITRHLQTPGPVYGTQLRGIDGIEEPLKSIDAMAEFHLDAVRSVQPQGPYTLVGYSLGGLVALEMAQRLRKNGEEIALLAMVDSYPHVCRLSAGQQARLFSRLASRRISSVGRRTSLKMTAWGARISKAQSRLSEYEAMNAQPRAPGSAPLSPGMKRVRACAHLAWKRHRPRFYDGTVKFVKAAGSSNFPDDPAAVWANVIGNFELEVTPGDHLEILSTYSSDLAALLSRYIAEAAV